MTQIHLWIFSNSLKTVYINGSPHSYDSTVSSSCSPLWCEVPGRICSKIFLDIFRYFFLSCNTPSQQKWLFGRLKGRKLGVKLRLCCGFLIGQTSFLTCGNSVVGDSDWMIYFSHMRNRASLVPPELISLWQFMTQLFSESISICTRIINLWWLNLFRIFWVSLNLQSVVCNLQMSCTNQGVT